MKNVRCAHTHLDGVGGRDPPSSGSLGWSAGDEDGISSTGIDVRESSYFDLARSFYFWEASPGGFLNDTIGASELAAFVPRAVEEVPVCWES